MNRANEEKMMRDAEEALAALEVGFDDMDQYVYVSSGTTREAYLAGVADDIRAHRCTPHEVQATVTEPGFEDIELGTKISGICVAKGGGYWLVYVPTRKTFFAFWGTSENALQAPGIEGGPLYCWSA